MLLAGCASSKLLAPNQYEPKRELRLVARGSFSISSACTSHALSLPSCPAAILLMSASLGVSLHKKYARREARSYGVSSCGVMSVGVASNSKRKMKLGDSTTPRLAQFTALAHVSLAVRAAWYRPIRRVISPFCG